MGKKDAKQFVQNDISKKFIDVAKTLVDSHSVKNYKEIVDAIGWTEASISSVKAGTINVPLKYIKTFEEVYKIPIITKIADKDIQSRLIRIEAHLEVFQISIAGLKSKKPEDFDQRFSELQKLISEAVMRRLSEAS